MLIHDAVEADAEGIMAIYNDAVAHTTAIWGDDIERAGIYAKRTDQPPPNGPV